MTTTAVKTVTLNIDNQQVTVPEGTTVMQAAEKLAIRIPHLCYHPRLHLEGSCRVCLVEIEGMNRPQASCTFPVSEGMVVYTNSPEIRDTRKTIVELLLANHPMDCQTCERDGNCELQYLAYSSGVRERHYEGERKHYENDFSSPSVIRDPDKCILCGRCVRVCAEVQGVSALGYINRGFKTVVTPAYNDPFTESVCVTCGQCINVCPVAAFLEKDYTKDVVKAIEDPDLHVIVQLAPSVRASIGEGFNLPPGTPMTGKAVAALRRLGFDEVFDTQMGADMTIMEEATEFVKRFKEGGKLPLITSCSSAWMKFAEHFYPDLLDNISTAKSPMSILGTLIKTYYAEKKGIPPEKIFNVGAMCCTAKKFEAWRPEQRIEVDGQLVPSIDRVITTRELVWLIKNAGLEFNNLPDEDFDPVLGISTGAGALFGATGGLAEAVYRTAYWMLTGKDLEQVVVEEVRSVAEGVKRWVARIGDYKFNFGVAHGLTNAHTLLRMVRRGEGDFHFIEIMGCPGGCIGGGGQPYARAGEGVPLDVENLKKRAEALRAIDAGKKLKRSYENPDVQYIYEHYLGQPLSEKAHKLLHTHYQPRLPHGVWNPDVLRTD
ncbi:MAG: NADH-dependent [FeFe] hydrogenase, group A6 [Armatimonadota bacterium]